MLKDSVLVSWLLVTLVGCSSPPPAKEATQDRALPPPNSIEGAEASAVCAAVDGTLYVSKLRVHYGCIFFEDVSAGALAGICSRIGEQMPEISAQCDNLDRVTWTDKRTGKPALLVKVIRHSLETERVVFGVRILTRSSSGFLCRVEIERSLEGHKIADLRVIVADSK